MVANNCVWNAYLKVDCIQAITETDHFSIGRSAGIKIAKIKSHSLSYVYFAIKPQTYRCSVLICPNRISLNVSISFIFSRNPEAPKFVLVTNEFDCSETLLPCRIKEPLSREADGLYDCNTSTQWVLSSGFSARKYQTQLFTDTSKRHSSNSWLCEQKKIIWFNQARKSVFVCNTITFIVALSRLIAPRQPKSLSNSLQNSKKVEKKGQMLQPIRNGIRICIYILPSVIGKCAVFQNNEAWLPSMNVIGPLAQIALKLGHCTTAIEIMVGVVTMRVAILHQIVIVSHIFPSWISSPHLLFIDSAAYWGSKSK